VKEASCIGDPGFSMGFVTTCNVGVDRETITTLSQLISTFAPCALKLIAHPTTTIQMKLPNLPTITPLQTVDKSVINILNICANDPFNLLAFRIGVIRC
jgi:hypothetical protein